ncbi:DUF2000 domain-containing protein [Streptomyces sp. NPDC002055]|uniref:DUF2000 domain-containing protein n=1 Tax=Streptomyces sp. NPDC002055 TaxID=3154534 RepID=UPI00332929A6
MHRDVATSKCVIVVNSALPTGLILNAASVTSLTLGQQVPELIGTDVKDADGGVHLGITFIPVPILQSTAEDLSRIHREAGSDPDVVVVGFSDLAQSSRTYEEYGERMATTPAQELTYAAVGIFGPKKLVNRLTGSLPLVR